MEKRFLLLSAFCFGIGMMNIQAQQSFVTAGASVSGSGVSVSYSIGQIVYNTCVGESCYIIQGVQQSIEISVITGIEEAIGINLEIVVYPNPTSDFVKLRVRNYQLDNLEFYLFDMSGKLIENTKITSEETLIRMQFLIPSIYFVKITDNKKEIKVFKIIKN